MDEKYRHELPYGPFLTKYWIRVVCCCSTAFLFSYFPIFGNEPQQYTAVYSLVINCLTFVLKYIYTSRLDYTIHHEDHVMLIVYTGTYYIPGTRYLAPRDDYDVYEYNCCPSRRRKLPLRRSWATPPHRNI